jgi:hypothetical protein
MLKSLSSPAPCSWRLKKIRNNIDYAVFVADVPRVPAALCEKNPVRPERARARANCFRVLTSTNID